MSNPQAVRVFLLCQSLAALVAGGVCTCSSHPSPFIEQRVHPPSGAASREKNRETSPTRARRPRSRGSDRPNQQIAPPQLEQAIGPDVLNTLSKQTGLSREDLLMRLSRELPDAVNKYTPQGRLPTEA